MYNYIKVKITVLINKCDRIEGLPIEIFGEQKRRKFLMANKFLLERIKEVIGTRCTYVTLNFYLRLFRKANIFLNKENVFQNVSVNPQLTC